MKPPRTSSDADLDAFIDVCDRIGGFDGHQTGPERVDGYLTAMVCVAPAVPFAQWVEALAGDAFERAFGDPEDRSHAERVFQTRRSVIADQLDAEALDTEPDRMRLTPLIFPWSDEERAQLQQEGKLTAEQARLLVTGAEWARGFGDALDDFRAAWPQPEDDEDDAYCMALVGQVLLLALPDDSEEMQALKAAVEGEPPDRDRLVDDACFAVQDLRLWVVDHAPRPETRRVDKQPGRNDPCPCGSGRKFKKCHGA